MTPSQMTHIVYNMVFQLSLSGPGLFRLPADSIARKRLSSSPHHIYNIYSTTVVDINKSLHTSRCCPSAVENIGGPTSD